MCNHLKGLPVYEIGEVLYVRMQCKYCTYVQGYNLLESSTKSYTADHCQYMNHRKVAKHNFAITEESTTGTVSDALDCMQI